MYLVGETVGISVIGLNDGLSDGLTVGSRVIYFTGWSVGKYVGVYVGAGVSQMHTVAGGEGGCNQPPPPCHP
jgi:hypothetical protein